MYMVMLPANSPISIPSFVRIKAEVININPSEAALNISTLGRKIENAHTDLIWAFLCLLLISRNVFASRSSRLNA